MYAVHVLISLGETSDRTEEATVEAADLGEVFTALTRAELAWPNFQAITIVHIEDFPSLMQGAVAEEPNDA
jgi:hypothetical protein